MRASDSALRDFLLYARSSCEDTRVLLFRNVGRYIHTCTYARVYMYIPVCTHVYVCVCACTDVQTQICAYTHVRTYHRYIHTFLCVCLYHKSNGLSCSYSCVSLGKIFTFSNPLSPGLLICNMEMIVNPGNGFGQVQRMMPALSP